MEIKKPTKEEIQNLKVGDLVLTVFGTRSRVTEIYGSGVDICGRTFVCFHAEWGPNSTISGSYKEGEVVRTLAVCDKYTSAQIQALDKSAL